MGWCRMGCLSRRRSKRAREGVPLMGYVSYGAMHVGSQSTLLQAVL